MASMRAPARPSWPNSPSAAWRISLRLASGWRRLPRRVVDETSSGIVLINQLVRLAERLARFNFSIKGKFARLFLECFFLWADKPGRLVHVDGPFEDPCIATLRRCASGPLGANSQGMTSDRQRSIADTTISQLAIAAEAQGSSVRLARPCPSGSIAVPSATRSWHGLFLPLL